MLLGELLNQMDGLQPNEGLLVVATTNDLGAIEPALTNRPQRFDCIMEIPEISDEIRRAYLERFVRDRGLNVRFLDEFDHLTSRCRTIAEVQEEAIRYLQRAIENGLDLSTVASPRELPELPPLTTCEAGAREIGFRSSRV
jgi:SpoVK/Ycf46/Vps4 family AAA+-type ATPase